MTASKVFTLSFVAVAFTTARTTSAHSDNRVRVAAKVVFLAVRKFLFSVKEALKMTSKILWYDLSESTTL